MVWKSLVSDVVNGHWTISIHFRSYYICHEVQTLAGTECKNTYISCACACSLRVIAIWCFDHKVVLKPLDLT